METKDTIRKCNALIWGQKSIIQRFVKRRQIYVIDVEGRPDKFKAISRSNIRDKEDVSKCLQTFMANTKVTFRISVVK